MPALIVEVAEAVTDVLNAAPLSQAFTAERLYVPVHELPDLDTLRVSVIAAKATTTRLSRSQNQYEFEIAVEIRKRCEDVTPTAFDPLLYLAEEIAELFRDNGLAAVADARCWEARIAPVFSSDHADQQKVFAALVTLVFRVYR